MLEPREADIPALFLVLVVLPLVTYILLGKWNDAAKKKTRISMLAQLAAEEASRVEAVTPAVVMSVSSSPKTGYHLCARCFSPSTTRCSRCKSVRYCSGKCQIIHWRQGHKQECQQVDNSDSNASTNLSSVTKSVRPNALLNQYPRSPCFSSDIKQPVLDSSCLDLSLHPPIVNAATFASTSSAVGTTQVSMAERKLTDDKWVSQKLNRETLKSEDAALHDSFEETNSNGATVPTLLRKKAGHESQIASTDDIPTKQNANNPAMSAHGRTIPSAVCPPYKRMAKNGSAFEPNSMSGISTLSHSGQNRTNAFEVTSVATDNGNFLSKERSMRNKMVELNSSNEKISPKASIGSRIPSHNLESLMSVSSMTEWNELREYPCSGTEKKAYMSKGTKIPQKTASTNIPSQCSNGILTTVDAKNVGVKKLPKVPRQDVAGRTSDRLKKITVLFPYEEFVKLYHCGVLDLIPRGLLNCGNSCYANAVLQCLTSTKPLIIYLLQRSHSRTCWANNWCLMCELEQHVSILREGRGPLSLSKILSHMRNIGTQMGGGDQEDAHEFLRLLVTSMQSICLEGLGGEKKVDTILQETTLIQQIFGGRLRSKVKCLRCHHESERYENIMDLTLEILGWVESLEDALTQFTSPEDLDGDNMYRCGRCATYVKARKQLSIHEAPNILTIVLKRFQTGKYGKINKCITFPDMLDMIPFMTGTGDSPPLYMLYGVVVHLDTLNASFSGHYVSYVKDLQGTWFRIDDTEVEPVSLSRVMSEGAYILFYSRSYPRPPRVYTGRTTPLQAPPYSKHCTSKAKKSSSRLGQIKQHDVLVASEHSLVHAANMGSYSKEETNIDMSHGAIDHSTRTSRNVLPTRPMYPESHIMDFSDATSSSDWSLFTSSDESSFTTESTRDSFSTVDYGDQHNSDPIFSIFNTFGVPEYSSSSVSCKKISPSEPQTRFFLESNGFVLDSSMSTQPLGSVHKRGPQQVTALTESLAPSANNCSMSVRYGSNHKDSFVRTSGCCKL